MLVLGIETSCDETSASVVADGQTILSNVISSQTDLHKEYQGVFPELACRRHLDDLIPAIEQALLDAQVTPEEIDLIAVTNRPGLIGALLMGVITAKSLSLAWDKPLVGVNHVEAHIYAAMMPILETITFPSLGVVISGGHTFMAKITAMGTYEILGRTVDDAVGEAFDKVAAMLSLPYPGGPAIEELAKKGASDRYPFKGGQVKGRPLDFSFSGLKTNVLYTLKGQSCDKTSPVVLADEEKPHIAASFQRAAFLDIVNKSLKAAELHGCQAIFLGGGVTQSRTLRTLFKEKSFLPLYWPPAGLSIDNAAMIAGLGYHVYLREGAASLDLETFPRLQGIL